LPGIRIVKGFAHETEDSAPAMFVTPTCPVEPGEREDGWADGGRRDVDFASSSRVDDQDRQEAPGRQGRRASCRLIEAESAGGCDIALILDVLASDSSRRIISPVMDS